MFVVLCIYFIFYFLKRKNQSTVGSHNGPQQHFCKTNKMNQTLRNYVLPLSSAATAAKNSTDDAITTTSIAVHAPTTAFHSSLTTTNPNDFYELTRSIYFNRHRAGFTWKGSIIPVIPSYFYPRFRFSLLNIEDEFKKEENQLARFTNSFYLLFRFLRKKNHHSDEDVEHSEAIYIPKTIFETIPIEPLEHSRRGYRYQKRCGINIMHPIQRVTISTGYNGFDEFRQQLQIKSTFGIFLIQVNHTVDEMDEIANEEDNITMATDYNLFTLDDVPLCALFGFSQ